MGCVYCYQVASSDCFKIGRTRNTAVKRLNNVSTGSWKKLSIYREIITDQPVHLEKQIHRLLDVHRAENGEYFNVTKPQLDNAVEEAEVFLTANLPIIQQAKKLQHQKPRGTALRLADEEIKALHRDLKEAVRQSFFLAQHIELLQSKLQIAIGDDLGIDGVALWKWRETVTLNSKLFKSEEPELFEKYKRMSATRCFRLL